MTDLVLVPFGDRFLGLTGEEFKAALERGRELVGSTAAPSGPNGDERLLTAEALEGLTSVPSTWFFEAARRGEIPHVKFGKYRRFRLDEVIASSRFQERGGAWARVTDTKTGF